MSSISTALAIYNFTQSYVVYSTILLVIVGVLGNMLNLLVFSKVKVFRGNPCAFYFYFESLINIGALLFTLISYLLTKIDDGSAGYSTVWCKMKSMLFQIFVPSALSTVCFAAIDQFLSTNHLFYIRQLSTLKLSRYCTWIALAFWILHSIPAGILSNSYLRIMCFPTNRRFNEYYSYFYYPILSGAFPMLIASVFSLLAFRNVRRIVRRQTPIVRRRLDQQMTALVFARVIILVTLYLPYVICYIYAITSIYTVNNLVQFMIIQLILAIDSSLVSINSAVNASFFLSRTI